MLIVGLLLHGFSMGGFSGFKSVLWIELVGLENLPTVTSVEALLSGINAILTPMLAGVLAQHFGVPQLIFYITATLMFGS